MAVATKFRKKNGNETKRERVGLKKKREFKRNAGGYKVAWKKRQRQVMNACKSVSEENPVVAKPGETAAVIFAGKPGGWPFIPRHGAEESLRRKHGGKNATKVCRYLFMEARSRGYVLFEEGGREEIRKVEYTRHRRHKKKKKKKRKENITHQKINKKNK